MSTFDNKAYARVVENGIQAVEAVQELRNAGYLSENIYVIDHDEARTEKIAEVARANEVGIEEEGALSAIANIFRSRGDELRAKIVSLGFTQSEAEFYERELDLGKVLVIVSRA